MKPSKPIEHSIHGLLQQRWSPRAFDASRSIDSATMESLFEAARWTPSCFNDQPWHFIYAHRSQEQAFGKLLACIMPANQTWAKNASVLMIAVASTQFRHNGKPNAHAIYDTGAAVMSLTLEATSQGLYVHQMGGFDPQAARDTFSIPAGNDPIVAIALGYIGSLEGLPAELQKREIDVPNRRTQQEFAFEGGWGA